jgi:hypothetical protein
MCFALPVLLDSVPLFDKSMSVLDGMLVGENHGRRLGQIPKKMVSHVVLYG